MEKLFLKEAPAGTGGDAKRRPRAIGGYLVERDTVGVGSRSKVKLGVSKADGTRVAVKRIELRKLDDAGKAELANELAALKRLEGLEGVVQLLHYEEDDRGRHGFLVMDLHAKDLYSYISERQRLPELEARALFAQMATAITECHARGVCHRDLKLENILIDRFAQRATLADFGFAAVDPEGGVMTKFCGSPFTVSPEIIKHTPYSMRTDVWSLGIVLYAMLTGRFPFNDNTPRRLFARISAGRYSAPSYLSTEAADLLSKMLVVDPAKRLAAGDILAHPWFECELSQ